MRKELWSNIKAVNDGKVAMSSEEKDKLIVEGIEMLVDDSITVGKLTGQADVFVAGGKGLMAAGALWFAIGKLSIYAARKIAEQYDLN